MIHLRTTDEPSFFFPFPFTSETSWGLKGQESQGSQAGSQSEVNACAHQCACVLLVYRLVFRSTRSKRCLHAHTYICTRSPPYTADPSVVEQVDYDAETICACLEFPRAGATWLVKVAAVLLHASHHSRGHIGCPYIISSCLPCPKSACGATTRHVAERASRISARRNISIPCATSVFERRCEFDMI